MYEDLIERLKIAADWAGKGFCITPSLCIESAAAIDELRKERKYGSWRHYEGELTCSECAVTIYDDIMGLLGDEEPWFCPNCGALMIGGDENV